MSEYVTLRDGSVLGRIIDWDDEGVPIIDTTDRPASRSADHEPDRYYGSGSGDDRPSEAPVGEPEVPPTRLEGASRPAAIHPAAGSRPQQSVAPRD